MKEEELSCILEKIYQKINKEIVEAYYSGKLKEVMKKYDLEEESYSYSNMDRAKILVIGDSAVKVDILKGLVKECGIPKNRVDFELDYKKLKNYNFGKLQFSLIYSDVIVGPMPHKVPGIENYNSFLSMIESKTEEYPKLVRLDSSSGLKITKEAFRKGLKSTKLYKYINE